MRSGSMALQLLIVSFGYLFLVFSLGWWVGVRVAKRERRRKLTRCGVGGRDCFDGDRCNCPCHDHVYKTYRGEL